MPGRRGRRWGWRAFVGALALLATLSALDPDGLRRYLRLERDARRMEDENARIAAENARLAREVRALRTDPSALERAAREELRFVRPGERVYWVGEGREAGP
ncbi:MAG TPA: septum formation initiator family protein [Anaeromyxobacter sp.]|nr:septum formation initiator family protein [Anaeromyxobacter sp.]